MSSVFSIDRRNDALADGAINEEKRGRPEPRDDLALNLGFPAFSSCSVFFFSAFVPPPLGARRLQFACASVCRVAGFSFGAPFPTSSYQIGRVNTRITRRTNLPSVSLSAWRSAGSKIYSQGNRRRGICRFLPAYWKTRSILRAWGVHAVVARQIVGGQLMRTWTSLAPASRTMRTILRLVVPRSDRRPG